MTGIESYNEYSARTRGLTSAGVNGLHSSDE